MTERSIIESLVLEAVVRSISAWSTWERYAWAQEAKSRLDGNPPKSVEEISAQASLMLTGARS